MRELWGLAVLGCLLPGPLPAQSPQGSSRSCLRRCEGCHGKVAGSLCKGAFCLCDFFCQLKKKTNLSKGHLGVGCSVIFSMANGKSHGKCIRLSNILVSCRTLLSGGLGCPGASVPAAVDEALFLGPQTLSRCWEERDTGLWALLRRRWAAAAALPAPVWEIVMSGK